MKTRYIVVWAFVTVTSRINAMARVPDAACSCAAAKFINSAPEPSGGCWPTAIKAWSGTATAISSGRAGVAAVVFVTEIVLIPAALALSRWGAANRVGNLALGALPLGGADV